MNTIFFFIIINDNVCCHIQDGMTESYIYGPYIWLYLFFFFYKYDYKFEQMLNLPAINFKVYLF